MYWYWRWRMNTLLERMDSICGSISVGGNPDLALEIRMKLEDIRRLMEDK